MKKKDSFSASKNKFDWKPAKAYELEWDLRMELGQELRELLIKKRLKQRELAELLETQQPEVSHLFNRNFSRFTVDKLIQFFNRLGWIVKFTVHPNDINCM